MQELRLVGIADDGEHLLLAGDDERYKLALDDTLRSTVRRDRHVTQAGAAAKQPDSPLRPRDVQALIRGGVPLDEIADRAGWSLEKVQRYEGPIRAERDYISERAQAVVLPSRVETITLRERAAARLIDRGVEAERVVWDSWKTDDVHWTVVVRFPAGGRLREATWLFDPINHSLRTVDDEARWLGGDELASAGEETPEAAAKSASTQRRRNAARDGRRLSVYDVEAEGGVADAQPPHLGAALTRADAGALTDSMRARQASRGRAQRSRASASHPTSLPGSHSPTSVESVEPFDVGSTPPPAPSHPRPEIQDDDAVVAAANSESEVQTPEAAAAVEQDAPARRSTPVKKVRGSKGAAKKASARAESQTSGTSQDADATATDAPSADAAEVESDETTAIPVSKRRTSRRSRSASERPSVREAFRGDDEENDEGLFGELPGFHDDGGEHDVDFDDADAPEVGDLPVEDDDADSHSPQEDSSSQQPPREVPERASKNRSGRPSVPSWDDIMFGGSRGPKS